MLSEKILEDLTKDCPCVIHGFSNEWCYCKEYLKSLGDRNTLQARLVVDYQWDRDKNKGISLTFHEAYIGFVGEGYAELFGTHYKEGVTREEIFPLLFGYEIQMPTEEEIKQFKITKAISLNN